MIRRKPKRTSYGVVLVAAMFCAQAALADASAVVLVYHHVAQATPSSTSVTQREFQNHLDYLEHNRFNVAPLAIVIEAIKAGASLPPRTVVLTFDDAYASVFTNVRPALAARGWPFTVFVTTDAIDQGLTRYMTWPQLMEIVRDGNHLGNHSATHAHPHDQSQAEFREDLDKAQRRIIGKTGFTPTTYAYPFGEFDAAQERIVADAGLTAMGQQSGALGRRTPMTQVPRFPISSRFADIDAFALRVNATPLPLRALAPESRVRKAGETLPRLVLQIDDSEFDMASISCFYDGAPIATEPLEARRFAIRAEGRFTQGRSKYTCTAPTRSSGAYAWYSHLWIAR